MGNTLCAMVALQLPAGIDSANHLVDTALANCLFATCTALHGTLRASPGSLAFGRDMILDIPVIGDWNFICQHRQQLINHCLVAAKIGVGIDFWLGPTHSY